VSTLVPTVPIMTRAALRRAGFILAFDPTTVLRRPRWFAVNASIGFDHHAH
jgi:hypothetical protein